MSEFVNKLYRNNSIIYKIILFILTTIAIVYLFPKGGQFKYDFSNGQLWKYDNLYAPFDFAIQKTANEIASEKKEIILNSKQYFEYNNAIVFDVKQAFNSKISSIITNDSINTEDVRTLKIIGDKVLSKIYEIGYLEIVIEEITFKNDEIIALMNENEVRDVLFKNLLKAEDILAIFSDNLNQKPYDFKQEKLLNILVNVVKPNVIYDKEFTNKIIENDIKQISLTRKSSFWRTNYSKRRNCRRKKIGHFKFFKN
jgi:cyclic-di-AMP phosphodiesterase PgpH